MRPAQLFRRGPAAGIASALLVACLAVLSFVAVLPGGQFVFDDHVLVEDNKDLGAAGMWRRAFQQDYYKTSQQPGGSGYYRPIAVVSNAIDVRLWGEKGYAGLHRTNLLLHAAASVVLPFALIALGATPPVAWITALFFAVHPVHAESVAFVSGRVDVLAGLGVFATLALLRRRRRGALPAFAAAALFAYLSKEAAVVLPLLVAIVWTGRDRTRSRDDDGWSLRWIALAVVSLLALLLRYAALGKWLPTSAAESGATAAAGPAVWGQSVLFALQSLYAPVKRLVMEPDPGALDTGRSILGGLVALVAWVVAARVERDARPFLRRAAMATVAAVLPVLNFLPQETPLSERFFYLASGFAFVPLGVLVNAGWRRRPAWRPAVALVTALALVGLAGLSAWRARAWRTDRIVWKIATEEEPRRATHWTHYGLALMQGREFRTAVRALQQAVELEPRNFNALHFLGMALHQNDQPDQAVTAYTRALELQPRNIEVHLNIGLSFVGLYRFEDAYPHFVLAVEAQPGNLDALRLAGGCAMQIGRYADSREYLDRGLRMVPNHPALRQARRLLDEKMAAPAAPPPAAAR